MSTASVPPPFPYAHPEPPPERPELPDGVPAETRAARWAPWTSIIALLAAIPAVLLGAIVIGVVAAAFGADFTDPPPSVTILGTVWQDLCLIGVALLFARLSDRPRPWHFGLRPTRFWPAVGWMVVAFVAFYVFTLVWILVLGVDTPEEELPDELGADDSTAALVAVAILVTVIAPVTEEFFFRGFFFGALRNWKGVWPAAILTGVVFGGIHGGSSDPVFLLPLAFFGFALCLLYVRTGSLYPCIALHCANNSLAFGITQDWTWQIPATFAGALMVIGLGALAVRARWGPRSPAPAPA